MTTTTSQTVQRAGASRFARKPETRAAHQGRVSKPRSAISPVLNSRAVANSGLLLATLPLRFLRLLMFNPSPAFCSSPHESGHFLTGRFTGGIVIKALIPLLPHGFTGKKDLYAVPSALCQHAIHCPLSLDLPRRLVAMERSGRGSPTKLGLAASKSDQDGSPNLSPPTHFWQVVTP